MTSRYIFRDKPNVTDRYRLYINVFELEHGCYAVYAMRTNIGVDAIAVIRQFNDPWIEEHPILRLYDVFDYRSRPNESYAEIEKYGTDPVVLRYMYMLSYHNVRGGSYHSMDLSREQVYSLNLLERLRIDGRCLCGQRGHEIMACEIYECYHCKSREHYGFQCKNVGSLTLPKTMVMQPVQNGKVRCLRCQTWQTETRDVCSNCEFNLKYSYAQKECEMPLSCSP
jgi:hypothetical protein